MKNGMVILVVLICLAACSDSKYQKAANIVDLSVSFADSKWDGKNVPQIGQCNICQGQGYSPPLLVQNIPEGADHLVVEYIDKTMGVHHGAIRFRINKKPDFTITSIPEQTFDLPPDAYLDTEHDAPIGRSGAYMAPCGCGYRNKYTATIYAIKFEDPGPSMLVGKGKITLGRF